MDPAFYQDLTGRHYGLLIVLEDRLNCEDAPVIHRFTGARHDALEREDHRPGGAPRGRHHGPGARAGPGGPSAAGE